MVTVVNSRTVWLMPFLAATVYATTEWFGDVRAHEAPADAAPFYDIVYDDDAVCSSSELSSSAVPGYMYFGIILSAFTVDDHIGCLQECLLKKGCQSVNYFRAMRYQQRGFCELLADSQYDRPAAMKPYRNTIYYEKIKCGPRDYVHEKEGELNSRKKSKPQTALSKDGMKKLFSKVKEFNARFRLRSK